MPDIWFIVKIFFLIGLLVYVVFAGVVVRQVYLMTETLEAGFETPIKIVVWAHLGVAIGIFVFAFSIL